MTDVQWHTISQWGTFIGAFITVLAVFGTVIFGNKITAAKNRQLIELKNNTAQSLESAAHATERAKAIELDLEKSKIENTKQALEFSKLQITVQEEMRKRADAERQLLEMRQKVDWRILNESVFIKTLKTYSNITERIEIIYNSDDEDASMFATRIHDVLHKAGCKVEHPKGKRTSEGRPFALDQGGIMTTDPEYRGLSILYSNVDENPYKDENSSLYALDKAFRACGYSPIFAGGYEGIRPPLGTIKIVVSSRL